MSLYWDKMLILKDESSSDNINELLISQKRPDFFAPKGGLNIHFLDNTEKNREKIYQELSEFYSKNNVLSNGNMTRVKPNDLKRYMEAADSEIVYCRSKLTKKVIGSILSVLFPILLNIDGLIVKDSTNKTDRYKKLITTDNPNHMVFAATTFLNNSKKYRGKGLGMVLIQKSLQIAYDHGVVCAYFLNTVARCSNAVEIKCWIFPLNIPKLERYRLGYIRRYRNYYLNLNFSGFTTKKIYKNLYYEEYKNLVKDKKFALYPDKNYWKNWINNFDTYAVKIDDQVIGFFCCIKYTIYSISCGKEINYGNRLICLGKQPETTQAMIQQCQKDEIDILLLQEVGDLDEDLLKSIHAQKTKTSDYLNFYNTQIRLEAKDIYAPMI